MIMRLLLSYGQRMKAKILKKERDVPRVEDDQNLEIVALLEKERNSALKIRKRKIIHMKTETIQSKMEIMMRVMDGKRKSLGIWMVRWTNLKVTRISRRENIRTMLIKTRLKRTMMKN